MTSTSQRRDTDAAGQGQTAGEILKISDDSFVDH
jgi:hypothetical protein